MNRVPAKEVSFSPELGLYLRGDEPFSGVTFTAFPGGELRSEVEYREGMLWGRSRSWHTNGQLLSEAEFAQDVIHGISGEWSPEGVLLSEIVAEYGIVLERREWNDAGLAANVRAAYRRVTMMAPQPPASPGASRKPATKFRAPRIRRTVSRCTPMPRP